MAWFRFNGRPCLNPADVISAMEQEGLPTDAVQKANSFTISSGKQPSTAYILITKDFLDKVIDEEVDAFTQSSEINRPIHTLDIVTKENNVFTNVLRFRNLSIVNAINVLGHKDNSKSVILVKLQDIRYWMSRTVIDNTYQPKNFLSTVNNYKSSTTTNYNQYKQLNTIVDESAGIRFYTIQEVLKSLMDSFYQTTGILGYNASFSEPVETNNELSYYLHNLEFKNKTYLEAVCKIAESLRLIYFVDEDMVQVFRSEEYDWPQNNKILHSTEDLAVYSIPLRIYSLCLSEMNAFYSDLVSSTRPLPRYAYEYTVPDQNNQIDSYLSIFVPYLYARIIKPEDNRSEINQLLEAIAARYAIMLKNRYKTTTWSGYVPLIDKIGISLDEVIYRDVGYGFTSTAVCKRLEDKNLNYTNPSFDDHYKLPHQMNLYIFEIVTLPRTCKILNLDGSETGETSVVVNDDFSMFTDLIVGDKGLCIGVKTYTTTTSGTQYETKYHMIQAPCGSS